MNIWALQIKQLPALLCNSAVQCKNSHRQHENERTGLCFNKTLFTKASGMDLATMLQFVLQMSETADMETNQ